MYVLHTATSAWTADDWRQLGVPGAFTGGCSKQIPSYIEHYEAFKAKDIKNIYVVAVNDQFAVKYVELLVFSMVLMSMSS